jgi:hypothetical protein
MKSPAGGGGRPAATTTVRHSGNNGANLKLYNREITISRACQSASIEMAYR